MTKERNGVIRLEKYSTEAKQLVAAHGVPVIPGYQGDDQSDDTLRAKAVGARWLEGKLRDRGIDGQLAREVVRAHLDPATAKDALGQGRGHAGILSSAEAAPRTWATG